MWAVLSTCPDRRNRILGPPCLSCPSADPIFLFVRRRISGRTRRILPSYHLCYCLSGPTGRPVAGRIGFGSAFPLACRACCRNHLIPFHCWEVGRWQLYLVLCRGYRL